VERISSSNGLSVHLYIQDNPYVSKLSPVSTNYFEGSNVEPKVVSDLRQLLNLPITKVMVLGDDVELIARVASHLQDAHSRNQIRQYRSITSLEVFHPAANKRSAVSYLAEEVMGLRAENVMAVGDDFTDLEMLQYAGIGVAMGNSPASVKARADWITTSIEEDGVARAIEWWIFSAKFPTPKRPAREYHAQDARASSN
jgi:Cof subfamily protein (haloacid dehalogenase superfamily)